MGATMNQERELRQLAEAVCEANRRIGDLGLAPLTWGNVSGIHRRNELVVIKPSGVPYEKLTPDRMAWVRLSDGQQVRGECSPSVDTPIHLTLYRAFPQIGAVAHTHSPFATAFAQACRPIPCLGTTHADHFRGAVPVTRMLTPAETARDFESATARTIVEAFQDLDPLETPAVLVAAHGPFTWAETPDGAVHNSVVLEYVARMALATLRIAPDIQPLPPHLADRHFQRKHGPGAYYGQHSP